MLHCEIILLLLGLIGLAFGIPGGWRDANVNDEGVREASLFATQVISDRANSMYHKKLTDVVKAETQVVSGIKYRVSLNMATTKCRKNEKSRNELDECDASTDHLPELCHVTVWIQSWTETRELLESNCQPVGPATSEEGNNINSVHPQPNTKF